MRLLKLMIALLCAASLCSGCFIAPAKEVYVAPGQGAELAEHIRAYCWITNKETGKRERRIVDTGKTPGVWYLDRYDRRLTEK